MRTDAINRSILKAFIAANVFSRTRLGSYRLQYIQYEYVQYTVRQQAHTINSNPAADKQQTGANRQQPADRQTRTAGSRVGGGARSLPTRARQIGTFPSGGTVTPAAGSTKFLNPPVWQPSPLAWQLNQPRRKLAFSTKHGRRLEQHQQDLRRARATIKS